MWNGLLFTALVTAAVLGPDVVPIQLVTVKLLVAQFGW